MARELSAVQIDNYDIEINDIMLMDADELVRELALANLAAVDGDEQQCKATLGYPSRRAMLKLPAALLRSDGGAKARELSAVQIDSYDMKYSGLTLIGSG